MPETRVTIGSEEQKLRNRVAEVRRKAGPSRPLDRQADCDLEFLLAMLDLERQQVAFYERQSEARTRHQMIQTEKAAARGERVHSSA